MNPVTTLSLARIGVGVTTLVNPELAGKLFGFDVKTNPQLPLMSRFFASREIALGAATLMARGGARRRMSALGMLVDGTDGWAAYDAMERGEVPRSTGLLLAVPAVAAVAAGAAGVVHRSKQPAED